MLKNLQARFYGKPFDIFKEVVVKSSSNRYYLYNDVIYHGCRWGVFFVSAQNIWYKINKMKEAEKYFKEWTNTEGNESRSFYDCMNDYKNEALDEVKEEINKVEKIVYDLAWNDYDKEDKQALSDIKGIIHKIRTKKP